jgi:hypothetical protein
MTIYFTNGQTKEIDENLEFVIKDNYLMIKLWSSDKTLYIPLYNVLFIERCQ